MKIKIQGSDGKFYDFLLKHEEKGDVRKESRFTEFIQYINELIDSDKTWRV